MKIRKLAALGAATVALSAIALPVTTASAQDEGVLTVQKLVLGDTEQTDFEFTVGCDTIEVTPPVPQAVSEPFFLADGDSQDLTESELTTDFGDGVDCTVVEGGLTDVPDDAWIFVTNSDGDVVATEETDVPEGAEFAWTFTTTESEDVLDYDVLVVNDYTTSGTADELCDVVEIELAELSDLIDSFGDIETLTPAQLEELWAAQTGIFFAGIEVAPPEIAEAWENATIAYIEVGQILESVGYDVDALTDEQIADIDVIFEGTTADFEAIGDFLIANCATIPEIEPTTTTTAQAAAVATTPQYAG